MLDGIITKDNVEYRKRSGIYAIINQVNKKMYIGSALNLYKRIFNEHVKDLNLNQHYNIHLQRAWNKHCEDNFYFKILEECEPQYLLIREQIWIDKFDFDKELFNICKKAGSPIGTKRSIEVKLKMRGRKHSESAKKKMSEAKKGKKIGARSKKYRFNNKSLLGRKRPESVKKKISEGLKGNKNAVGNKNNLGNKHSEETKQKMREAKIISNGAKAAKSVIQFDKTHNIIKIYPSVMEAHRKTGIPQCSISLVCRNKQKSSGGYLWKFEKDYKESI